MKFDFVIGNPPYQDETIGDNTKNPPVYNNFMDEAFRIADKVEMIHPARFLFNAGDTPKSWNRERLSDTHFKVLEYQDDCKQVFANTDIKGGIAITYRDANQKFGAIDFFAPQKEVNMIVKKINQYLSDSNLSDIAYASTSYSFSSKMHEDDPTLKDKFSKGHQYDVDSNAFDRLDGTVIYDNKPDDGFEYIRLYGRYNNQRVYKWIRRDYIKSHPNLDKWKAIVPKSNGSGKFGEVLSLPEVKGPGIGLTRTFMSFGAFDTESEANNVIRYLKTKFLRTLLSAKKITQDNPISVWDKIPLQDFTSSSDIDWSQSIANIDKQLYKKYNLSDEEINFIETNVKEME